MADTKPNGDGDANRLKAYWLTGTGGTVKIRWNTPGDFDRCVKELDKYMPGRAEGYCANLHKIATGNWPGSDANRVASGKPPRGKVIGPG